MLTLRACPRCQGDLYTNRDLYGSYKQCLQCGYMKDVEGSNRLLEALKLTEFKRNAA